MKVPGRGAVISDDGLYRYGLTRRWGEGRGLLWIMLNPSTADASTDDRTISRVIDYTRAWGYPAADVVNLFAFRATHPVDLFAADDPVGPETDRTIWTAALRAGRIVCAWGAKGALDYRRDGVIHQRRDHDVLGILRKALAPSAWCLGRTKAGHPKHPLYISKTQPLELFWTPKADSETNDGLADVIPLRRQP